MTSSTNERVERDLAELRGDLLRGRPRQLGPDEGGEAFQQHKLLAAAVHRATKLDREQRESETSAWVRYVSAHFPPGRNNADDARLLFGDWRSALLKRGAPGPGITLTHGHSQIHRRRDQHGRLCLNLEDTWDEFAASVDSFIEYLRTASRRRKVVLARWRTQQWVVEPFVPDSLVGLAGATVMEVPLSASAASGSASVSSGTTRINLLGAESITASPPPHKPKP